MADKTPKTGNPAAVSSFVETYAADILSLQTMMQNGAKLEVTSTCSAALLMLKGNLPVPFGAGLPYDVVRLQVTGSLKKLGNLNDDFIDNTMKASIWVARYVTKYRAIFAGVLQANSVENAAILLADWFRTNGQTSRLAISKFCVAGIKGAQAEKPKAAEADRVADIVRRTAGNPELVFDAAAFGVKAFNGLNAEQKAAFGKAVTEAYLAYLKTIADGNAAAAALELENAPDVEQDAPAFAEAG